MTPLLWFGLWLTLPPALVCGVALGAQRLEAARERRRHHRAVAALGPPVPSENIATIAPRSVVTLDGTLVAESPLVSFHPFGTSFFDEPNVYAVTQLPTAGAIAIDLANGGRAMLEGAAQIVVGSVESEHETPLERARELGAETLTSMKVRARQGQFRTVRAGDRVRVRGVVEPAPDDDAFYRARSSTLRVTPPIPDSAGTPVAIPICATDTAARRRLAPSRRFLAMLVASCALGALGALGIGRQADQPPKAITSAGPRSKEPPCRKEVIALLERGSAEAPRAAIACGDAWTDAHVHWAAGEFRAASAAFKVAVANDPEIAPSLSEVEAHLFAHDHAAATGTAQRMVRHFYPGPSTAEKRDLECIVGLLEASGADGGGEAALTERSYRGTYRRICSKRPFLKFARDLDSEGGFAGGDGVEWRDWINGVYRPEAAFDPILLPRTAAFGTRPRLLARPVGVERRVLDRLRFAELMSSTAIARGDYGRFAAFEHPSDYVLQTTPFAAELTLFFAFSGFPERAKPYWPILDRVAEVAASGAVFHRGPSPAFTSEKKALDDEHAIVEWEMSIAAAAALFAGDVARMRRYAEVGEPHSASSVVQLERALRFDAPWEEPKEDGHWPEHAPLFAAGKAGDGKQLVKALVAQKTTGRAVLARLVPRIRRDREALNAWFHSSDYPAACLGCGASSYHGHLSDRREVARILGDAGEHERLTPIAERFTDALTDAEIAFELDELETFFHRNNG